MMLVKINTRLCVKISPAITCRRSESVIASNSSPTVSPNVAYPPVEDVSFKARFRKYNDDWHEKVKNVKSVEGKMIKINMPRYYGFRCMIYQEGKVSYNESPHVQFITRTHVVEKPGLPSYYDDIIESDKLNSLVEQIKKSIEDGVVFELSDLQRSFEKSHELHNIQGRIEDSNADVVGKQVNRIILASLAKEYPHLLETQVDFDPRIEAFWFTGGMHMGKYARIGMKNRRWDEVLDEPLNKPIQYIGRPLLQLRHHLPLKEILPMAECENPEWEVPIIRYDPRTQGHCMKRRHAATIPGFWPGDTYEFGLLSYHKCGYLSARPEGIEDVSDALKTQAILTSYAWLLGQASHLGFTTFNDITYPLVNQSVITNGQLWSFCVYQLNTTLVNGWHSEKNPKRNICWITEPLKLFEKVEDGKLIGFNDEVLKHLIKFYVNAPQEKIGVNLTPYLSKIAPRIAFSRSDERRNWIENLYKNLMSNRPRHRLMPELYHWERIYKQIFKTRPIDKKRTAWDFGKNPLLRRLNETSPIYIAKFLRPDHLKKKKFANTYYP